MPMLRALVEPTREDQIVALIAAQSRDDQTWKLRLRRHEVRAADLDTRAEPDRGRQVLEGAIERGELAALRLSQLADDRIRAAVLVGFTPTWTAAIVHFDPARGRACPCCGGTQGRSPLKRGEHCLCCGGTRRHPVQEPMQEVSDKFDPGRRAKLGLPPLRGRVRRLKGGVGTAA